MGEGGIILPAPGYVLRYIPAAVRGQSPSFLDGDLGGILQRPLIIEFLREDEF